MKKLKRIVSLSLALLMLATTLFGAGCASSLKKLTELSSKLQANASLIGNALDLDALLALASSGETESQKPRPTMPDDGVAFQDYSDRTIRLLGWTEACQHEFEVSEENATTMLTAAVWTRNETVEKRLNVDLQWTYVSGCAGSEESYVSMAKSRLTAQKVDIFTPYSRVGNMLMIQGLAQDMKGISTIDLTDPWWNQSFVQNASVNDRVYFAAGDISWTLTGMTFAFCYNKDILAKHPGILDQFGVDSMNELVSEGKWTLETMKTMAQAVTDEKYHGITGYHVAMDSFYKGCDLDWMEVDPSTGNQIISDDQYSGRANDVVKQLTTLFNSSASTVQVRQSQTYGEIAQAGNYSNPSNPEWQKGRSLFVFNSIISITDYKFNELSFDFGILPMPKYDEAQPAYKTVPDFEYSMCVIPRQASDADAEIFGAVLTAMASEGYVRITPCYYYEVMQQESSDSPENYAMWMLIQRSAELDGGRLFDWQIAGCGVWGCFRSALANKEDSLAGKWAASGQTMISDAEAMNQKMQLLEESTEIK